MTSDDDDDDDEMREGGCPRGWQRTADLYSYTPEPEETRIKMKTCLNI